MTTETVAEQVAREVYDPWRLGPATAVLMRMIGFEPHSEEQAAVLRCRKRFKLVVGGGQAGKSREAGADWVVHVIEDRPNKKPDRPLLYWLLAADYGGCRAEYDYIADNARALNWYVRDDKRIDPGKIEIWLAPPEPGEPPFIVVETKSGKHPQKLAMFSPNGIILCEASQIDYQSYMKAQERVAASGGWLHLSGTFEFGSFGWYPGMAAAWEHGTADKQSFRIAATLNKHVYPGGANDEKILAFKRDSSDDYFLERIMGIAAPPKGRVFDEFREEIHVRECTYNPDLPLYIWDDPGYGHAHAIELAQIAQGGQVQLVGEIYERGKTTEDLIDAFMHSEWWANPTKVLVIDPHYATQHHGTHSIAEIWLEKTALATMGVKVGISEGIERLKTFLKVNALTGQPGIVIDPSCRGILSELGVYPSPFYEQPRWEVYSWDVDNDGTVRGNGPIDRFNDGCKAVIYGLVQHFGLVRPEGSEHFVMTRHVDTNAHRSSRLERIRDRRLARRW